MFFNLEKQFAASKQQKCRLMQQLLTGKKRQKKFASSVPTNWLQQITGSFKDEPGFDEVIAYGSAIREGEKLATKTLEEL